MLKIASAALPRREKRPFRKRGKSPKLPRKTKIEKSRPGETPQKMPRKMPRLFTVNWTSAAFGHRMPSTSLKGWAVYACAKVHKGAPRFEGRISDRGHVLETGRRCKIA